MKLRELIKDLDIVSIKGDIDKDVVDIAYHDARVRTNTIFVAIRGNVVDGHQFIGDAVRKGASVIVSEKDSEAHESATLVRVKDARAALARLSARYFCEPSNQIRLVGITGTNGKTTITYLLESVFKEAGLVPGVIGTIENRFGGRRIDSANTTPESYDLQKLFKEMVDRGVNACAMEVSSHALTLERVVGCHFDGAIFTNLSPEHLDFHGEMESYFESKVRLFRERLTESKKQNVFAVINADDPYGRRLAKDVDHALWPYSLEGKGEVNACELICNADGIRMKAKTPAGNFICLSGLLGRFNAQNILATVSAGLALGLPLEAIKLGIEKVKAVPGRLERVTNHRHILALVDYAHTPDALEKVLRHARDLISRQNGRLIVVFGCGGNRDRTKRPLMGRAATSIADVSIVTTDNPRNEKPEAIIEDILAGINDTHCEVIVDLKAAIRHAVQIAREGDVLVVAGKGHEDYQIVCGERRHFDDREVLREFMSYDE